LRAAEEADYDTEGQTTEAVATVTRQLEAAVSAARAERAAAEERVAELNAKVRSSQDDVAKALQAGPWGCRSPRHGMLLNY
jgi:DnaJ-domain-containing protein 1